VQYESAAQEVAIDLDYDRVLECDAALRRARLRLQHDANHVLKKTSIESQKSDKRLYRRMSYSYCKLMTTVPLICRSLYCTLQSRDLIAPQIHQILAS
jgi:hypothetical protein